RSDIFSFGVVLYEMLEGRRPFSGANDLEVLQTIIHGTPEPLGEIVPLALRIAVEKSIEKDPTERYQTIRDLVVDLRRLTKHKVAEVAPAAVAKTPWRWLPWAVVAGLAAGVVLWEGRRSAAPLENPIANAHFTRFTNFEGDEDDATIS